MSRKQQSEQNLDPCLGSIEHKITGRSLRYQNNTARGADKLNRPP